MNRLFLWPMVLVACSHFGVVRAADPAPAPDSPAALPAAASPLQCSPEPSGPCWQPDGCACCDPGCGPFGLVGGAGLYWFQPYFSNNPAFSVSRTSPTGPGGTDRTVTERSNISHHMQVAPLLWLGYVSESGFGGRVRWWYFCQGTDQSVQAGPAAPGTLTFLASAPPLGFPAFTDNDGQTAALAVTSKLQFQVWDAEALVSVQSGRWDLLFAGGLRFAQINQSYNAYATGDSGGAKGPITATVLSEHSFPGVGPVLALEARRGLGDSGLSFYSSARGAVLFGSARQTATDIFSSADGTFADSAAADHNPVVPVAELELGLEVNRRIGPSRAFGQIALVGQEWWGIGSASRAVNTNTFGVPEAGGGAIVDSNVGFLGLAFRVGVNY